jgi:hypothetical protein
VSIPRISTGTHKLFRLFFKTDSSTLKTGLAAMLFCIVKKQSFKNDSGQLKQNRK